MPDLELLKAADIAKIFNQSLSWVSKNHKKLGGIKIGGRMFFPPQEKLYERLFCGEKGVAVRFHAEGREVHQSMVPNQARSQQSGTAKKIRVEQADLNRHGLLDTP
ncbi:hypothetical protein [Desulfopila sp. IMCC35008]|uniref:hypothetical protein n=1 Tax=Desulfopila sp. IMCC35008 TaxID=2653858 RepID=UPI001F0E20E8|nr:hypothetical protein [Desulfopila sp. IMCC35008]